MSIRASAWPRSANISGNKQKTSLFRSEKGKAPGRALFLFAPGAQNFLPQSGPGFSLRPEGADVSSPRGSAPSPHSLFGGAAAEKRWWGRPSFRPEGGISRPAPCAELLFPAWDHAPARGEIPLSSDSGKTIPQAAFTQGGLYGAALPQRKKRPFGRSPRVCAESRTAGAAFTPPSRTGLRPAFPGRRGCFRPPECGGGRCGCDKRRGRP